MWVSSATVIQGGPVAVHGQSLSGDMIRVVYF